MFFIERESQMRAQRTVRTLAAAALVGTGWALTRVARGVRQAADVVKPEPGGPVADDEARPVVQEPPSVAVPYEDSPAHVRVPETHVDELAAKPAADVIKAVDRLSTDELSRLYEHEQTHKKRKTVLAAIEEALSPTG